MSAVICAFGIVITMFERLETIMDLLQKVRSLEEKSDPWNPWKIKYP
jgi:hypothetical protein